MAKNAYAEKLMANPRYRGLAGMTTSGLVGEPAFVPQESGQGGWMQGSRGYMQDEQDQVDSDYAQARMMQTGQNAGDRRSQDDLARRWQMADAGAARQRDDYAQAPMRNAESAPPGYARMVGGNRGPSPQEMAALIERLSRRQGGGDGGNDAYVEPAYRAGANPYQPRATELNNRNSLTRYGGVGIKG